MIYILSDDIRTGKTSALLNWITKKSNVNGLLCPDDDHGKRYFLKIKSKDTFPLETETGAEAEDDIIAIGPFQFLTSAFQKANDFLFSIASETTWKYLIIDELGKLELKAEGLHPAAEVLIPKFMTNSSQHLILVVRASLLDAIIAQYHISEYKILRKEDLNDLS